MKWEKKEINPEQVRELAAKYGCDQLTASILIRRNITSGDEIRFFLEDDQRHLRNPFELPGMEDAVERIIAAKEEGEKILVFGDRDTDGITSTSLLAGALKNLGMDVSWQIPTGDERYGLSMDAVENFAKNSGTLIITVDCGISNLAEIRRANELCVDVIVTDHHNPQDELPEALAIVNPKLQGSKYPFQYMAGCGVAYKLVSALRFALKSIYYDQPVCLLNTRPVNDAWIIEIVKIRNLCITGTLAETLVFDSETGRSLVSITETRLPAFLEGQMIHVWDAPLHKKIFSKLFGNGVEIGLIDLAPDIGKLIPSTAGKSLLRIKELSRIAKYQDNECGELEVLVNLFTAFVQRNAKIFDSDDASDLQLVCLGTIADIMPMKDENRIMVQKGISSMSEKTRPGLSNLFSRLEFTGAGRRISAQDISWQLCPVINSAGRMGSPEKAVELFLEKDESRRNKLTNEIISMNEGRKKAGEEGWFIVEKRARDNLITFNSKLAAAYGDDIQRGFTGIHANRLAGLFKIPAIVISISKEGQVQGSLRSPGNFNLKYLLEPCADLFLDWGGHDCAAGFSMDTKTNPQNWDDFLQRLKNLVSSMDIEAQDESVLMIDAELPLKYLNPEIFKTIDIFEPYGEENRPLLFMSRGLKIADISLMGKPEAKHVKLSLDTGAYKWPAKYWNAAEKVNREFTAGDKADVVFSLGRNWFKGMETPEMVVSDIKRSCEGRG
ncbi:MAG: single-stranded-DNA-specific exonuclease RecJ [Treponema sp.]|nr:single-stranded-DNA-specific exonuclease RecJ [Treponema sp.]